MKALLLAAGLGSRLGSLTANRPKALLPIGGKSLLEHNLRRIASFGVRTIVVNLHHHADQVVQALRKIDLPDVQILLSDEREFLLETGGALRHATPLLEGDEPILIHNVDILSDLDLGALLEAHHANQALATLSVSERISTRALLFDDQKRLCGWHNFQTGATRPETLESHWQTLRPLPFSGIQIVSPRIFPLLTDFPARFSLVDAYLGLCDTHPIEAFIQPSLRLIDVGKPDAIAQAEALINTFHKIDLLY